MYINLVQRKREHQAEQRRIQAEMDYRSAEHQKLGRERDQIDARLRMAEAKLQEAVAAKAAAGERAAEAAANADIQRLYGLVDRLRAQSGQRTREMDAVKAAYADWQSHMPAKWDPQPMACPECGGVGTVAGDHRDWGICPKCDADIHLGKKPIVRDGVVYAVARRHSGQRRQRRASHRRR